MRLRRCSAESSSASGGRSSYGSAGTFQALKMSGSRNVKKTTAASDERCSVVCGYRRCRLRIGLAGRGQKNGGARAVTVSVCEAGGGGGQFECACGVKGPTERGRTASLAHMNGVSRSCVLSVNVSRG